MALHKDAPPQERISLPNHMSWSSLSSWLECGERWRLTRGHHYPESTWYATLAGSAIHSITEWIDRAVYSGSDWMDASLDSPSFEELFEESVKKKQEDGLEVKASGRQGKTLTESGGPNKKDYNWWLEFGPEYIDRWVNWRMANPDWRIADINGQPGIELEVTLDIGDTTILGYIDRVFEIDGSYAILDLKTGSVPAGVLQMATYAIMLKEQTCIEPDSMYYWTPTTKRGDKPGLGTISGPFNVHAYDLIHISDMYRHARHGIEAGIFIPHVTNMCRSCPVRDQCWAVGDGSPYGVPIRSEFATDEKRGTIETTDNRKEGND